MTKRLGHTGGIAICQSRTLCSRLRDPWETFPGTKEPWAPFPSPAAYTHPQPWEPAHRSQLPPANSAPLRPGDPHATHPGLSCGPTPFPRQPASDLASAGPFQQQTLQGLWATGPHPPHPGHTACLPHHARCPRDPSPPTCPWQQSPEAVPQAWGHVSGHSREQHCPTVTRAVGGGEEGTQQATCGPSRGLPTEESLP